jgi:hypothetical protein
MKKILTLAVAFPLLFACNSKPDQSNEMGAGKTGTTTMDSVNQNKAVEFADSKYMDIGRQQIQQLANGNVDGFMSQFADNAVFLWSGGDSLTGKKEIDNYWRNRRMNVIDSLKITNDIWLPIKVNQPQKGPDMPGIWLLSWFQFDSKYKNGKRAGGWIHADLHFDSKDKIDRYIQYIDRLPLQVANAK